MVKLKDMTKEQVLHLLVRLANAKREFVEAKRLERFEEPEYDDSKGYSVRLFSDRYNKARLRFVKARAAVVDTFGFRGTRYDKYSTVRYLDSQQQAERLSPETAIALWQRAKLAKKR